jgi:hypothetical protein
MSEIVKIDTLLADLVAAGFDYDSEIASTLPGGNHLDVPMIRIEHRDNGKHRLYIDYGESYLSDVPTEKDLGNSFSGIVFAEQLIRALWSEGDENIPTCAAINGKPTVDEPLSANCISCKESAIGSNCKPKIRLWLMLDDGQPYLFHLSPTSLKHWNLHKQKLKRSGLPIVALKTLFSLKAIKRNGYAYAEVEIGVEKAVTKEELVLAREFRKEFERMMSRISESDFKEQGDKSVD